jgi:hypothetical protein
MHMTRKQFATQQEWEAAHNMSWPEYVAAQRDHQAAIDEAFYFTFWNEIACMGDAGIVAVKMLMISCKGDIERAVHEVRFFGRQEPLTWGTAPEIEKDPPLPGQTSDTLRAAAREIRAATAQQEREIVAAAEAKLAANEGRHGVQLELPFPKS